MTELERQLTNALQQLAKDFDEREKRLQAFFDKRESVLNDRIENLQQQVAGLSKSVNELIGGYNRVVQLLNEG